jgi:hypothetical protein
MVSGPPSTPKLSRIAAAIALTASTAVVFVFAFMSSGSAIPLPPGRCQANARSIQESGAGSTLAGTGVAEDYRHPALLAGFACRLLDASGPRDSQPLHAPLQNLTRAIEPPRGCTDVPVFPSERIENPLPPEGIKYLPHLFVSRHLSQDAPNRWQVKENHHEGTGRKACLAFSESQTRSREGL